MIFDWLGLTGENIVAFKILATILGFVALIVMLVFSILYSRNIMENRRLARGYIRVSTIAGMAMGTLGLFGFGSMWYFDVLIIVFNSFTYYINRD